MTVTAAAADAATMDAAWQRRMMIRAVVASAVGTTIEWYDFFPFKTSQAIAVVMSASALISLTCVWLLRDRAGALDHE